MSYEVTTIESICSRVLSGGTPRRSVPEYYRGGCIPWLNTKEIDYNRIYKTENHITPLGLERSSAKWIAPNSVIVAMYGATAGKVAINKIPVTTNQACCNLEIDSRKADYNYVYYYLKWKYPELSNLASGAAQQNLNVGIIKAFPISLPPLEVQKVIGETLSCLDAKIDLNDRMNENLEKQAQAIFKSWFVDFEPFRDGEFVDSIIGSIPKGWKVEKLEDLVNIKYGKDHRSLPDGDIPVYGSGGLIRYISEAIYTSESVLIPRKGTLNNVMLVNHPFWSVDTMFYTEINKPNFAKFLFQLLKRKDLASMNVGSAVPSMTVALLNQIRFVLPPDEILEQFERVTNPFYLKIENNRRQNQILAALRDTLLPKLMSGEIEVPVV